MANSNAPFGLLPLRKQGGEIQASPYSIASGYGTAIMRGTPVKRTGTGTNISVAAAGEVATGVFAGVSYVNSSNYQVFLPYWPASAATFDGSDAQALVWDDPAIVFQGQCDTLAAGDLGALSDWVSGTGNTYTGTSGFYVEGSSTATSGKSLRLLRLLDVPDNAFGAYARAEVMFAEHYLLGITSSVGGV